MSSGINYWSRIAAARLTRRSLLRTSAVAGADAAVLALTGCSGDHEDAATPDRSGLLSKPEDTSDRAVSGGTLNLAWPSDVNHFDVLAGGSSIFGDYAYARLVLAAKVFNVARGEQLDTSVDPYAAEAWERSPDGLQLTFRLRPDGRTDPRAPTSGRVLDAQDVLFSFNKFRATGTNRTALVNDLNKEAPIASISASDGRTIVVKLAYPSASVLQLLGGHVFLALQPREADGGFDPKTTMRGSGPWMLEEYRASTSLRFKKNPNFYRKDRPFLDAVYNPIIPEYAQTVAQLRAGGLHNALVRAEEIIQTKRDTPSLAMYPDENFGSAISIAFFSFRPGSVWRDDRLRQALSMLVDRDLYISKLFNVEEFARQGLPIDTRWNTIFPAGEEPFWMDPKSSEFGPNARYFKFDLAEAKKLVRASGKGPTVEAWWNIAEGNVFGPQYQRAAEIIKGMWEEGRNFKFNAVTHHYSTVFFPKIVTRPQEGRQFEGLGYGFNAGPADLDPYLRNYYMPGGTFSHLEADYPNDAQWESLIRAQMTELDPQKRLSILKDVQRLHAARLYKINSPGLARGFTLWHRSVKNVGALKSRFNLGVAAAQFLHWWIDRTKA